MFCPVGDPLLGLLLGVVVFRGLLLGVVVFRGWLLGVVVGVRACCCLGWLLLLLFPGWGSGGPFFVLQSVLDPQSSAVPSRRFPIVRSRPAVLVVPTGRGSGVEVVDRPFVVW